MKTWTLSALALLLLYSVSSTAEQRSVCFAGQDQQGASSSMVLHAEHIGDYFEISGNIKSPNIGIMKIKADGWSGAGRMFRSHEYESNALYIRIKNYSEGGLLLEVDGFGSFPFYATTC